MLFLVSMSTHMEVPAAREESPVLLKAHFPAASPAQAPGHLPAGARLRPELLPAGRAWSPPPARPLCRRRVPRSGTQLRGVTQCSLSLHQVQSAKCLQLAASPRASGDLPLAPVSRNVGTSLTALRYFSLSPDEPSSGRRFHLFPLASSVPDTRESLFNVHSWS